MKICIIVPKGLPVPSVKGGAIETLVNNIIDINEKEKKLDITVVSIYDKVALEYSKKYKHSNFIYIRKNLRYFLESFIVKMKNLFGSHLNTYNQLILKKIKNKKFDKIVVEDGAYHSFQTYTKYYDKSQMYLHFHHVGLSDKNTDSTFDNFIAVSDFVKNNFKKNTKVKNLYTLRNGIKVENLEKNITKKEYLELRNKYNFELDDFIVVFCGRLVKNKGVLELVNAVNNIKDEKVKLLIVGSINFGIKETSKYLQKLEDIINNSNGKINLTGFVDNSLIYKYYKISNVGVVPSTYEDAAPLVPIEMMASGLPTIITNSGGAPEFASPKTKIVIKEKNLEKELEKAIIYVKENIEYQESSRVINQEFAKKYNVKNFYDNFIKILELEAKDE